jgi:hypothetical protein
LKCFGKAFSLVLASLILVACAGVSQSPQSDAAPQPSTLSTSKSISGASQEIFVIDCMDYVQSPAELQLYCADGGQQLSKITWASWTAESAFGLATSSKNICDPDCASGNYDVRIASLLLTDPVITKGDRKVFSRLTLKYDKPLTDGEREEVVDLLTEPMP